MLYPERAYVMIGTAGHQTEAGSQDPARPGNGATLTPVPNGPPRISKGHVPQNGLSIDKIERARHSQNHLGQSPGGLQF